MGDFVRVATVGELSDPGSTVVEVDGDLIALFHVEGVYYALDDVCTHDGGPLASGELTGHKVACPRHGAKFDIRTGAALSMPAVRATRAHDVKVENGGVWVRLRSGHGVDGPVAQSPVAKPATGLPIAPPPAAVPASSGVVAVPASNEGSAAAPSAAAAGALCEDSVRELLKQVKDLWRHPHSLDRDARQAAGVGRHDDDEPGLPGRSAAHRGYEADGRGTPGSGGRGGADRHGAPLDPRPHDR